MGFFEEYLAKHRDQRRKLARDAIKGVDRYDKMDQERIEKEMGDYRKERDALLDSVPETGYDMWADTFYSFLKAVPKVHAPGDMRPSHLLNRAVAEELQGLPDWERLRTWTEGDPIGAGGAVCTMREDLESLVDRAKTSQELSQQLQDDIDYLFGDDEDEDDCGHDPDECTCTFTDEEIDNDPDAEAGEGDDECGPQGKPKNPPKNKSKGKKKHKGNGGATGRKRNLDRMIEQWRNLPNDRQDAGQGQQLQDQADALQKAIDERMAHAKGVSDDLEKTIQDAVEASSEGLGQAMSDAADANEQLFAMARGWGMEDGALKKMPAKARMELAQRINNNEKLKRMAEIWGKMQRVADTEQMKKVYHVKEEIYDIGIGNDLARVLPSEFSALRDPTLKLDFFRRFTEGKLMQYEMQGHEKVGKGGIYFLMDNSGSMSGDREVWAKAVGLCALNIAKDQKREFYGIHFSSARQLQIWDFRKPEDITLERVLEFAEHFFNGGTDFVAPLSRALVELEREFAEHGATQGDIVLATDGDCGVPQDWLDKYRERQEALGFSIYGVMIGNGRDYEYPGTAGLTSIAEGKVTTITDILAAEGSAEPVRDLFRIL